MFLPSANLNWFTFPVLCVSELFPFTFVQITSRLILKKQFLSILQQNKIQAAIFDLDGTILDNNQYHLKSWLKYLESKQISISQEDFGKNISGRTNKDAVEYIFKRKMSDEEAMHYTLEKETVYREMYAPYIQPVNGLFDLLNFFWQEKIRMAIATSGIQPNIDFMFEYVAIENYFEEIVHSAHIQNGKPHPEIYLTTADRLDVQPSRCIVFEDSFPGIASAKAAGMHVIAMATTHTKEELGEADLVVNDFSELLT